MFDPGIVAPIRARTTRCESSLRASISAPLRRGEGRPSETASTTTASWVEPDRRDGPVDLVARNGEEEKIRVHGLLVRRLGMRADFPSGALGAFA